MTHIDPSFFDSFANRGRKLMTTEEIQERVRNWYATTTPEQQAEMWRLQRESWVRAFAPCEHGELDWETCPGCLAGTESSRGDAR